MKYFGCVCNYLHVLLVFDLLEQWFLISFFSFNIHNNQSWGQNKLIDLWNKICTMSDIWQLWTRKPQMYQQLGYWLIKDVFLMNLNRSLIDKNLESLRSWLLDKTQVESKTACWKWKDLNYPLKYGAAKLQLVTRSIWKKCWQPTNLPLTFGCLPTFVFFEPQSWMAVTYDLRFVLPQHITINHCQHN